jgi:phage repressor protein C with HTH and peptisase S24 domain
MCSAYAENVITGIRYGMSDLIDLDSVRLSLKRIMSQKGLKPTTLSQMVGNSKTLVKEILEGNGDIKLSTLVRLAGAMDVDVADLLQKPRVPIAGYIGAGGQVAFEDMGEDIAPDCTVMHPPGLSGKLVALMVRGDSMLPKYKDGDIIYIQRDHDGVLPDYIGEDCAVRVSTGETYIKQLAYGSREGLFTLRSLNAADIEDVEIEWATPIALIMPGRSRRLFVN